MMKKKVKKKHGFQTSSVFSRNIPFIAQSDMAMETINKTGITYWTVYCNIRSLC